MNIKIPVFILPSLLFTALCVIPLVTLWFFKRRIAGKKSPLNMDLLRNPGESLLEQVEDINYEILWNVLSIPVFSMIVYSAVVTTYIVYDNISNVFMTVCIIGFIGMISYYVVKLYKLLKIRNHLRLGYECELAVGQELSNRMRDGCYVFHDFPADKFNIDQLLTK